MSHDLEIQSSHLGENILEASNDNQILLSINDVCRMTSLSRSAINQARDRGAFPLAVKLGEKRIAFVRAEVAEWIDQRIAARAA